MSRRPAPPLVEEVLEEAKRRGHLGPAPVSLHLSHSLAFAAVVTDELSAGPRLIDIGSGGGVPGLVLAAVLPAAQVLLLEGSSRRAEWLREALFLLSLEDRVGVVEMRAEEAAHLDSLRASFDGVTARSFASPAVTAECGAGFLKDAGALFVSEPPDDDFDSRWPTEGLRELGLAKAEHKSADGFSFAVIACMTQAPARYPRRTGIPAKRPLF